MTKPSLPLDLLRARLAGPLLRRPHLQAALQWVLLLGYAGLVLLGWGRDAIPGVPEEHPRIYTHATTLVFWVVWFMGLVLLAPLTGRAWCGVCPLGAAADWLGRRGFGLSWPRWLPAGAGMLALFGAGVAAVVWGEAHKSPAGTAAFVAAVGGVAVASALLWRRSAFCKGLCPVGSALHLYSRHAPLSIRPRDPAGCRSCTDHSCTTTRGSWRRWNLGNLVVQRRSYAAGCPVALYPPDMDMGACLLCLRCVRNCTRGNLGLYLGRRPASLRPLDRPRALLLVLLAGLVLLALLRTWPAARDALTPGAFPPAWAAALWLGLALPIGLLLAPAALGALGAALGGRPAPAPGPGAAPRPDSAPRKTVFWAAAQAHLPAFVGPVLGGHTAIALVKLNAKAAYLPYLVYVPDGGATYLAIHVAKTLPLPDLLLPLSSLRWAALGCLALGTLGGLREALRRWPRPWGRLPTALYAAALAALTTLYGAALVHWLFPWSRG